MTSVRLKQNYMQRNIQSGAHQLYLVGTKAEDT